MLAGIHRLFKVGWLAAYDRPSALRRGGTPNPPERFDHNAGVPQVALAQIERLAALGLSFAT